MAKNGTRRAIYSATMAGLRSSAAPCALFLSSGEDQIDRDAFQDTLRSFVGKILNRLRDEGVEETFLEQEWAAIENATGVSVSSVPVLPEDLLVAMEAARA